MKQILIIFIVLGLMAASARAAITGTTGAANGTQSIPSNLSLNASESNTEIFVYAEQQNRVLGGNLDLDITEAGLYEPGPSMDERADLSPDVVLAGTTVNSYIVHFDEVSGGPYTLEGSVTLDKPILGLIILTDYLNASDSELGASGTTYDGTSVRGLDILTHDQDPLQLTLNINESTVWFRLTVNNAMDELRIIEVPEPATICLLGLGGLLLRRRKSA